jgi:hypothetical protein
VRKSKGWGVATLAIGALLIAGGLIVRFVVYPSQAKFPDDVDTTRTYDGELAVMLNAEALQSGDLTALFLRDVPVTLSRHVQTLETGGDNGAIVIEEAAMDGPAGMIAGSTDVHAIDRTTMEHIDNFSSDDRVVRRTGLVFGWPIGSEQQDYIGWNDDTQSTVPITYEGEAERGGVDTYKYRAVSAPQTIVNPVVLANFPEALPKDLIAQITPALGLPDELLAQLGQLIEVLPDAVPLAYTFAFDKTYWIEPTTGVLIDTDVMESRVAAIAVPGQDPVGLAEVQHLTYTQSAQSVQDAADDANDAKSTINLFSVTIPLLAVLGGLILLVIGLYLLLRKGREPATDAP